MLGNLLDTSPVPGRANETPGRKNTGAGTDQSQQRFAHYLAEERRRSPEHSREAAQSAAEPAPPLRHRTGQMDAPHGKALPVQRQSNEAATPPGAEKRPLRADAPESRTNPKPERDSDADQDTAPTSVHGATDNTAPEGLTLTLEEGTVGRRLADLKTTLGPQAEPDELLAESGVPVNSPATGEHNVLATVLEGDAKWLDGTGAAGLDPQGAYWTGEALAAESGGNIQFIASDNGFSAEWLEGLSDNELADLWQSLQEGQQPISDEELAALLAETQTRPDVLNLAQFSPDWVKIQKSEGENAGMLNASDKAGTPGSATEGKLLSTAGVETDIEVDAEAANKEPTLPERPRGSLADLMATRIDAEVGRGLSVDDSGTMRQNIDALSPKQVVADLVKQHIERQIPVKNSASELTQRLSERMVMMIGQDIQEARIRLNPPEMGNLDIRVTTQNDQVQVQVVAQQPVVRDLLEHHAHRLREMLEQQGFGQVNVDVSEHSDRRGHDDGRDDDAAGADMTADDESEWRDGGTVEQSVGLVDHYV